MEEYDIISIVLLKLSVETEDFRMKKFTKVDLIIVICILVIIGGIVFASLMSGDSGNKKESSTSNDAASTSALSESKEFDGRIMGIRTGSSFEQPTFENFPKSEYQYFDTSTDLMMALKGNKIDAFMEDEPVAKMMCIENHDLAYFKDPLVVDDYSFAFQKDTEKSKRLVTEFNEMVQELWSSGEIDKMIYKWMEGPESERTIDKSGIKGENGQLVVALPNDCPPFSYYYNNELTGYAIELCTKFATRYGYSIVYEEVKFASMITGLSSGKYDIAANSISVTEERKKSMTFSDTIYKGGMMLIVRSADVTGSKVIQFGDNTAAPSNVSVLKEDELYKAFDGKKIGIHTGSSFEQPTFDLLPNGEYSYYDTTSDLVLALQQGKIDAFLYDEPIARSIAFERSDLDYIKKPLIGDNYSFGYPKNLESSTKQMNEFNELLKELKSSGELEKICTKWIEGDASERVIDDSRLTGENGTISVAILPDIPPFSYYENNKIVGIAIDLTTRFAEKYGYKVEYEGVTVAALFAGLSAGKYDFAACILSPTEERKESMNFSDTFYEGGINLVARKSELEDLLNSANFENYTEPEYTEFDGKVIGILTGSSFEPVTLEKFPNSEYVYFDNNSDLILALEQGKIDAFVEDEPVARMINKEKPNIDYLKKVLVEDDYSFGFQKDTESSRRLVKQFNDMLSEMWANGEIDRLIDKWFNDTDSQKTIDRSGLTGENGELKIAARGNKPPFSYFENNEYTGYGVELVTIFARKYGYTLSFDDTNLSALLAGLASEKYDIGISALSVTEERKKSIDFSDTFYKGGMALVVRTADIKSNGSGTTSSDTSSEEKQGFFDSLKDSFEKNFVREDRWKLIVQGIGTTCAITALTVIFGSILAFLICMFRRTKSVLAGKICNLYVKLLQGTPMVVLLMILYYVVFGKSGFDALWVAVIGFSLNFGAYGSEIMRSGIESIDNGQREAALALGFTENQGFFKFIFPQAAVRFLPVYRGEIISLLKNTSIVGYIAIQDITKMSDIIRSRTFEAFFPLIATAVIYFVLAWIISFALSKVLKVVDPKQKKKKNIKGVTMQ